MDKIKIGYFADGPWSHNAFKLLNADPEIEIEFIVPRCNTKDDTLLKYAKNFGIDYLPNSRINSEEFIEKVKRYDCHIFVSMSFNQIFKSKLIYLPPLKTINCHAGKLPFYRGRNVLNWVLINDEKEFGITVHYIDTGIDTGDIILQRTYPISDNDNYSTLLEKAYVECANILYDAIKLIQKGNIKIIKQTNIHPVGFYCGVRKNGDEIINWQQTSRELFNFIRALCKPGPQATSYCNDKPIKINKAALIKNAPNYKLIVGQVVGKTDNSFIIKTKDSTLEILEYEYDGIIKIGDKLG